MKGYLVDGDLGGPATRLDRRFAWGVSMRM